MWNELAEQTMILGRRSVSLGDEASRIADGENVARPFTMFWIERRLSKVEGDVESTRLLELFIVVLHQPINYFVCSFGPVH